MQSDSCKSHPDFYCYLRAPFLSSARNNRNYAFNVLHFFLKKIIIIVQHEGSPSHIINQFERASFSQFLGHLHTGTPFFLLFQLCSRPSCSKSSQCRRDYSIQFARKDQSNKRKNAFKLQINKLVRFFSFILTTIRCSH